MRLRRQMGSAGSRILTRPTGYTIEVQDPAELEAAEVDCLRRDARAVAQAGRWPEVSELLSMALGLWRGEPLADVPSRAFTQQVAHLTELRLQLTESRIDADLRLARHDELVAELRQLAAENPLREHLRVRLMLAFYRCGRQAEALEAYRSMRATLMDELGVEPTSELQEMHRRVLTGDPGLLVIEPSRDADQVPALAATLLRHPGAVLLVAIRPAVTPETLRTAERGLTLLCAAGFPVGQALDTLNALTLFVVAHAASEVSTAAVNSAAAAGSQDYVASLDERDFPLLTRAARISAGTDDRTRFEFAIAAFIRGLTPAS
jgi:DNA-binding SARP family transcriptional activator